MVLRLEEIRLRHLDAPVEDAAYTEAFREYGLDVAALQPTAMADYIRARPIHKDLTVALDFWAYDRRATRTPDDVSWKRLLAVSRAADPDELRNQIREAVEHNDAQALARMVAVLKGSEQPVQTISLLAKALISPEDGAAILRPAQQKYPDDYHINFQLGWVLERIPRQELDEAMRFYTAAVALRPRNAPARFCLGHVLDHLGKRAEAMVEFRKAVEIQPNYALAHYRIGNLLHRQGELEQAVAAYGKAIEYEPAFASARNRRGQAYAALGDWTKAAADLAPKTESGMPSDCWVQVACLRLLQSDVKAYQQLCGQVPQHVEPTTDPVEGMYQASRICTLSANGSVAAPRVVGWAEQAVAAAKTPPRQHVASRLHVLGLAHYRTGQFEQAEHCCRESLEFDPNWPGRILNWLVLAMAHQRLGHADEARTWLAKAVQWRDGLTIGGDKRVAVCPRGLYLTDWLEFHVLLPEAHALGEGKAEK
jgi:tetratricopeptide (TPR) repeat protein